MPYTAITLARSGSKGLPNKNILPIQGIALSHFPILAVNNCPSIARLIYSSDSESYLDKASDTFSSLTNPTFKFIPHRRTAENSSDTASSWEAISEIVNALCSPHSDDGVILISATCPTISAADIERFCRQINYSTSALSARPVDYPPENTFCISDGKFEPHVMTSFLSARQDSKPIFRPDGHLYFRSYSDLNNTFPSLNTTIVNLNKPYYVNVDTPSDYTLARLLLEDQ